jgi:hypothetical protein
MEIDFSGAVGCPPRILTTPRVARSGDGARMIMSACATRVARTLVLAAFALMRAPGNFLSKFLAWTAHKEALRF